MRGGPRLYVPAAPPAPPESLRRRQTSPETVDGSGRVDGSGEVDLLQRRLAKVKGLLQEREDQLRRLDSAGGVEVGLASIYREVQGIVDKGPEAERKRELMTSIFEANQELHEKLRAARDGTRRIG